MPLRLYNIYGVTECTIYQLVSENLLEKKKPPKKRKGSNASEAGEQSKPGGFAPLVPSVGWRIDAESGELHLRGPLVLRYAGDPENGRDKFYREWCDESQQACDWFATGDAFDPTTFRILGRLDRQIKLNGFRIELGEVESVILNGLEMVAACVCHLDNKHSTNPRLMCFVKMQEGVKVDWKVAKIIIRMY